MKKCDINLDTIFQIADEVMQTQPNSSLIRAVTPDMRGPLSVPLSAHNNNPANTTKANYFSSGNITTSKIDSAYLFAQRELSVNSQPEEMLKDAILEVSQDIVDGCRSTVNLQIPVHYLLKFPLCSGKVTIDDVKD